MSNQEMLNQTLLQIMMLKQKCISLGFTPTTIGIVEFCNEILQDLAEEQKEEILAFVIFSEQITDRYVEILSGDVKDDNDTKKPKRIKFC